jgi:hypothetical protein
MEVVSALYSASTETKESQMFAQWKKVLLVLGSISLTSSTSFASMENTGFEAYYEFVF